MQTLNIHQVQSVTLSEISHYEAEINREAFSVRRLEVTDTSGNKISIELYANDAKALRVIADWNQDQSITL
jgi:hypothetical protein